MIKGRVHSIETSGFFDGPGIRTVVFFQGCPLRCTYCHNPDTWEFSKGQDYTVSQLMERILKNKNYYKTSGGGVTFSGGEPLMQPDFLIEMLKACRKSGIHSVIDSSGILIPDKEKLELIIDLSDLFILDIKASDEENYQKMTGRKDYNILQFIDLLNKYKKKVWARYVLIEDVNDDEEDIKKVKEIINKIDNLDKIEVLPFHQLGSYKYEEMGIEYPLKDHPETAKEKALELQRTLGDA